MSRNDQLILRFKERSHLQLQRVLHFGGWVRFTHLKHNFGSGNRAYRGPSLSIKIRASVPPQRVLSVPGAQPPPRLRALLPRHRPPPPGRLPPPPASAGPHRRRPFAPAPRRPAGNSRVVGAGGLPISEIHRDAADGEAEETLHLGSRSARIRRSASVAPTGTAGPHGRSDLARRAPRPRAGLRGPLLRSGCGAQVRRLRGAAALDGAHPPPHALRLVPQHLRQ